MRQDVRSFFHWKIRKSFSTQSKEPLGRKTSYQKSNHRERATHYTKQTTEIMKETIPTPWFSS